MGARLGEGGLGAVEAAHARGALVETAVAILVPRVVLALPRHLDEVVDARCDHNRAARSRRALGGLGADLLGLGLGHLLLLGV